MKELLEIWKERRRQTYNVPSLVAILDSQVLKKSVWMFHIYKRKIRSCGFVDACGWFVLEAGNGAEQNRELVTC